MHLGGVETAYRMSSAARTISPPHYPLKATPPTLCPSFYIVFIPSQEKLNRARNPQCALVFVRFDAPCRSVSSVGTWKSTGSTWTAKCVNSNLCC